MYNKPHKDDHAGEMRRGKHWRLKGVCNNDLLPLPLASQQVKLASFPSSDFLLTQTPNVSHRAREVSLKEVSPFLSVARVVGGPGDEHPFRKSLPSDLGKYLKNKAWLHALCLEINKELL